jgi:hypothetical protein
MRARCLALSGLLFVLLGTATVVLGATREAGAHPFWTGLGAGVLFGLWLAFLIGGVVYLREERKERDAHWFLQREFQQRWRAFEERMRQEWK